MPRGPVFCLVRRCLSYKFNYGHLRGISGTRAHFGDAQVAAGAVFVSFGGLQELACSAHITKARDQQAAVGKRGALAARHHLFHHRADFFGLGERRLHFAAQYERAGKRLEQGCPLALLATEFSVDVTVSHGIVSLTYSYFRTMPKFAKARLISCMDLGPRPSISTKSCSFLRASPPTVRMFAFSKAEMVRDESSRSSMRVFIASAELSALATTASPTAASLAATSSSRKPTTALSWVIIISIDCSSAERGVNVPSVSILTRRRLKSVRSPTRMFSTS